MMSAIRKNRANQQHVGLRLLLPTMLATAIAMLAACATKPSIEVSTASRSDFQLDKVYIYSFLDVRQSNLGRNYLAQFEKLLTEELAKRQVQSRQLWFNRSETARHTAMADNVTFVSLYGQDSTTLVPVKRTVGENQPDEGNFGARYRMILFPKNVAGERYSVHLDIEDAATGRLLWYATMRGWNFNWVLQDEVPEQRALLGVQSIIEALDRSHLLPAASPEGTSKSPAPSPSQETPDGRESAASSSNDYEQMRVRYQDRLARQRARANPTAGSKAGAAQ